MTKLGPRKAEILRAALDGNWFSAHHRAPNYQHCLRLFERGFLRRDFPDIYRFTITNKGREAILAHDAALAKAAA